MILTYLTAQCTPLTRKHKDAFLIVLANGNTANSLMGLSTKYGTGSGDIAPLGSLNRSHIRDIFEFLKSVFKWEELDAYCVGTDKKCTDTLLTAKSLTNKTNIELSPYELECLYKFRSDRFCGPFSMFDNLSEFWNKMDPDELETKIENFFLMYSHQRHKCVIGTPNVHCSVYSCDPKSKDVRPMFYGGFEHQFLKMKKLKNQVMMAKKSKKYIMEHLEYTRFQIDGNESEYTEEVAGGAGHDSMTPFNYMS